VCLNKKLKLINSNLNYLFHVPRFFNLGGTDFKFPQRAKRKYSSTTSNKDLPPMWLTGFSDAEGCFSIIIEVMSPLKWKVRSSFEINLHDRDLDILYKIQSFFGVGSVYVRPSRKLAVYRVSNVADLINVIIPHFIKYPLISNKKADFLLWSKVVSLLSKKEHLKKEGFLTILSYYAAINRGVSKKVSLHFPEITPSERPKLTFPENLNPYWVSGFVAGDGGFSVYIKDKTETSKFRISYRFFVTQHIRDLELMNLFCKYFNCGLVAVRSNPTTPRCDFIVQDKKSIIENIIPHFESYPMFNLKQTDFIIFKECMIKINSKDHLTVLGLDAIKTLILKMVNNDQK
jgi:hypothetical protein